MPPAPEYDIEPNDRASNSTKKRQRKRAAVACATCHKRKVRCNVALCGPPCANCLHDDVECTVTHRQRTSAPRKVHTLLRASESGASAISTPSPSPGSLVQNFSGSQRQSIPTLSGQLWLPGVSPRSSERSVLSYVNPIAEKQTGSSADDNSGRQDRDCDEGENSAAYVVALDGDVVDMDAAPFYVGDQQGLRFVSDLCKPDRASKGNHYLVPRATAKSQPAEVIALLCMQGAFSLPPETACRDLLRCYFNYVHPFLPIVNASDFLTQYLRGDPQRVNLILLWSMFFAAASFVDSDTYAAAGYASRKEMKRAMYRRAKSLYDVDYEKDKIALIQSVILMGFWYADTEDRTGSWHWIGVAISLCQTIGLHREVETDQPHKRGYSISQRSLWRRIWWSCYFRDTWLSLGMGRPMRVNIDDCDTPMPSVDDVLAEIIGISATVKDQFLPEGAAQLARYWVSLLELTVALGGVLATHYRPARRAMPTTSDIEANEKEILKCAEVCRHNGDFSNRIVELHHYELQLYYSATMISLYRPYVLQGPKGLDRAQQEAWRLTALRKAKEAASSANAVLNKIISTDLVHVCQAMTVTALIPTIQIHLLGATSSNLLARRLAQNQLDLCMIVLTELRETYWAADFLSQLFSNVRKRLDARNETTTTTTEHESDRTIVMTPELTNSEKELSISEEPISNGSFLPNEFLSNGWNPFLYPPAGCNMDANLDLDLDVNSFFSSEELNGLWRCHDNENSTVLE